MQILQILGPNQIIPGTTMNRRPSGPEWHAGGFLLFRGAFLARDLLLIVIVYEILPN